MPQPSPADRSSTASIGFVLATIAIDALAFGIVVPVVPNLVMHLSGKGAAGASVWLGLLLTAFSAMQFLCAPVLGALSDRFGRRPVLLLSLAGICVNNMLLAWAPSLGWLFVGRLVAGATAANFAAATASIADVSTPAQRTQRFGLVGAMFGLGFVVGPALGGVLGELDLRLPFLVAGGLAGLNLLYGAVFVPETLAPANRRSFTWRAANPVGNLALVMADHGFARLVAAWCCTWFALGALQSSFVLANDLRLGWGARENGLALGLVGVGSALVQGFVVRRAVPALGERRAALLGYALSGAAYLLFAAAVTPWILLAGIALQSASAISGPAVQSLVSARAGPDRQGAMQGTLASFQGLTAIGAPLLTGWVFGVFTAEGAAVHLPGAPFLLAVAAYALAFWAVWGLTVPTPGHDAAAPAARRQPDGGHPADGRRGDVLHRPGCGREMGEPEHPAARNGFAALSVGAGVHHRALPALVPARAAAGPAPEAAGRSGRDAGAGDGVRVHRTAFPAAGPGHRHPVRGAADHRRPGRAAAGRAPGPAPGGGDRRGVRGRADRDAAGGAGSLGVFAAAATALFNAAYALTTRQLAGRDRPLTTLFWSGAVGAVLAAPLLPISGVAPPWRVWPAVALMGALATLGHYLMILANERARASVLAPFSYTQLVGATALGWLVFGDVPDGWTLAGGAIVGLSGVYVVLHERRERGGP